MNNSSVRQMRRLSIIWGLMLFLIVGLLTTFGIIYNNKNKLYKDMEKSLVAASKKYVDQSFSYPEEGKELQITYATLKDSGFIKKIAVNKKECDGYVIVKKKSGAYNYKGYVKCPEYQTKNYAK